MEGNKTSFILICIIAALSLVIVFLSTYIFVNSGLPHNLIDKVTNANNGSNEVSMNGLKRPSQDELGIKKLFNDKVIYNLKSINDGDNSVIQVSVAIEFYKKVKGIKNVEEKLNSYDSAIKELVGTYFQKMTINEVKDPDTKLRAKKELTNEINKLLNSDEISEYRIIYDVIFEDWFYQ
ncbi:MAG TPA: flagellar basal body-associated FliL family protein [Clostridiaceae bacterium]|nr:flagellar basal body-associated FliL family protein [Clostridiaceae bacterium]